MVTARRLAAAAAVAAAALLCGAAVGWTSLAALVALWLTPFVALAAVLLAFAVHDREDDRDRRQVRATVVLGCVPCVALLTAFLVLTPPFAA